MNLSDLANTLNFYQKKVEFKGNIFLGTEEFSDETHLWGKHRCGPNTTDAASLRPSLFQKRGKRHLVQEGAAFKVAPFKRQWTDSSKLSEEKVYGSLSSYSYRSFSPPTAGNMS